MKKILVYMIRFYQKYISALKGHSTCRFYPTCSEYAVQAIQKKGVIRGGFLALKRICKCHPFHSGGYDPMK